MAEDSAEKKSFLDSFAEFSAKIGNQVHLRSLRDAFATVMPIYILAGIAVLINNVVLPLFLRGDVLLNAQYWVLQSLRARSISRRSCLLASWATA